MIIYNVTISVNESITIEWLDWIKNEHIVEVMDSGLFIKARINKVIAHGDSNNTFAIAYTCNSMKDLHQYQINFADKIQQKHIKRYADNACFFHTIMEVIEEF